MGPGRTGIAVRQGLVLQGDVARLPAGDPMRSSKLSFPSAIVEPKNVHALLAAQLGAEHDSVGVWVEGRPIPRTLVPAILAVNFGPS